MRSDKCVVHTSLPKMHLAQEIKVWVAIYSGSSGTKLQDTAIISAYLSIYL